MKWLMTFVLLVFSAIICLNAGNSGMALASGGGAEKKTAAAAPSKTGGDAESCVATAKGPIAANPQDKESVKGSTVSQSAMPQIARVGKPAPNFEASAFQNGKFKNVKLSDFKGRWVVLCFYPGDFTFV